MRPESLVLVHGAGSGPWVFSGWPESFPWLHTVAVDLQTGLDAGHASHEDYARVVVDMCSSVPAPFVLCGWSMGGLVAMQAASRTRPHSLVLLEASAPGEVQGFHSDTVVVDGTYDPEAVYGPFPVGMPARPESVRAKTERRRGISIPRLPCRSLVVHGREFPRERGTDLAARYGADVRAFPDLDHWGLVRDPIVRTETAEWLMSHSGSLR